MVLFYLWLLIEQRHFDSDVHWNESLVVQLQSNIVQCCLDRHLHVSRIASHMFHLSLIGWQKHVYCTGNLLFNTFFQYAV